jgi:probable addiction module antidote protein
MGNLTDFDMSEYLDSPEAIAEYISQVLEDGDQDEFLRAMGYIAKAKGMSQISKETGLGRESLYKTFQEGAEPKFSTIMKVMKAIGMNIHADPMSTRHRVASA